MNFNQIIEALGLEKLASSPGGTREQPGGMGQPSPGSPGTPEPTGAPGDGDPPPAEAAAMPEEPADGGQAFDWDEDGDADDAAPEEEEGDVGGSMEEIRHELDQIAADVDANESSIRGIQSQHEEVLDRLDAIEEHNSQLLGIYDRLTAGINPFAEDWEARYDRSRDDPEAADNRYNVIEPPDGAERDPVGSEPAEPEPAETGTEPEDGVDDAVGFDDLRDRQTEESGPDPTATEEPEPEPSRAEAGAVDTDRPPEADDDAYLGRLETGYATEVLLMEWLTMLIDIAGAPGALKALDYYENIGWISNPVKHQLEDFLGGARVPAETPARRPGDLTTEEHNHSFAYIMKLEQQHGSQPDVHLD